MVEPHEHEWKWATRRPISDTRVRKRFRCAFSGCRETYVEDAPAREVALWAAQEARRAGIHHVWQEFVKVFGKDPDDTDELDPKALREEKKLAQFAEKYPTHVRVCACDDSSFMTMDLVLIDHRSVYVHMGTTMILVSQHGDYKEAFLYPNHRGGLLRALGEIHARGRKLNREEERRLRLEGKKVSSVPLGKFPLKKEQQDE